MSVAKDEVRRDAGRRLADDGAASELVPLLIAVAKSTRVLAGIALRDVGLVAGQDDMILALGGGGRMSVGAISEALAVRPATISKMSDRLKDKGFVVRSTDAGDARRVMLALTQSGRELHDRVCAIYEAFAADLQRELGANAAVVGDALLRLDSVLSRRLQRLR